MSMLIIGAEGALCVNGATTWDAPSFQEVFLVRDVSLKLPWDWAEFTSREGALKLNKKALTGIEVTVQMRADPKSPVYHAWVDAAVSRLTYFDLLILNAKANVEGARGVRGYFQISMDEEPQVLADGTYSTFTCKPTLGEDGNAVVAAVVGSGGALNYQAFGYEI